MERLFDLVGCLRGRIIALSYMLDDVNAIVLKMLTLDISAQQVGLPSLNCLFNETPDPRVCT
jgi:hypothetical protein